MCVTGSEDTYLNLVVFTGSEVKVIQRLHGHISSVRTVTVVPSEADEGKYFTQVVSRLQMFYFETFLQKTYQLTFHYVNRWQDVHVVFWRW